MPARTLLFLFFCAAVLSACATADYAAPSNQRSSRTAPIISENIDAEIVGELNRARMNPPAYAEAIARRLSDYDGTEGTRAIREAIEVLRRTEPMPPLTFSRPVSRAARDHVSDQGPTGRTGHAGSDGSDPFSRICRYVDTRGAAENIAYGLYEAEDIVVELLIDDGVPDRGHRRNILNPNYANVGVATGPHGRYGFMCVMDFTYPIAPTASTK